VHPVAKSHQVLANT
jgi:hypothetical protein